MGSYAVTALLSKPFGAADLQRVIVEAFDRTDSVAAAAAAASSVAGQAAVSTAVGSTITRSGGISTTNASGSAAASTSHAPTDAGTASSRLRLPLRGGVFPRSESVTCGASDGGECSQCGAA